ncbi:DUF2922 domain-containing protein [Desulfofundulus salinus]|uniref:DUF2922 domain-containing protein n=1 Tax=Desulfofundulus salinus TaxID=2419843 RepID=A0A494X3M2_9FIRM|nr:DUF2922 domain-containing protein [Desulfofundulus salinum]RKO67807.1 DUF2922 domain-containing protein [Desulfofundulus salinum]
MTLNLNNPRDNLTAAEVQNAMDQIIARNVFLTSGGALVSKVSAQTARPNVLFEEAS